MAINNEVLNQQMYDLLKVKGYKPVGLAFENNELKKVPIEKADVIRFTFKKDNEAYGNSYISLDDELKIYYDENQEGSPDARSVDLDYDDTWSGLLHHLKYWAMSHQLPFELSNKSELGDDLAKRNYMKRKQNMLEGYYPLNKMSSYNDAIPSVKIILQHTRQIQEGEQRYRNIAKIFLENQNGERFLAPTTRPGIAQIYARHIAEGGVPNDDRWDHIKGLCEEYNKMAGFVRAVKSNQFNESAQKLVNEGINHYQNLRETLGKMRGHRGYNAYFESWTPTLMEDESEDNNINEFFVQETLDPRIESVLPILSKLSKSVVEMKEVDELAEWADNLTEAPGAMTFKHNQNTEKSNLKAFDLDEAEADDAAQKIKTPAVHRKATGKPDWKVTGQDLEKAKEKNISGKEGLAALTKHLQDIGQLEEEEVEEGVEEGAQKKPNATTRHLRDYPVSDKEVAKPVKKPEKKKPEQGVAEGEGKTQKYEMMMRNGQVKKFVAKDDADAKRIAAGHGAKSVIRLRGDVPAGKVTEMDKSQPSHGRDGKISHSTYGSRDKEGSDYFKGKEVPVKPITVKKMEKDALDILKKQGVAEGLGNKKVTIQGLKNWIAKAQAEGYEVEEVMKGEMWRAVNPKTGGLKGTFHTTDTPGRGSLWGSGPDGTPANSGTLVIKQGVAEGSLNEGQYEMMMRNGQVKKFIAKDDADAKRIAAGYGAKSVIKLRGGVPAGKIAEKGVAEGWNDRLDDPDDYEGHLERLRDLADLKRMQDKENKPTDKEDNSKKKVDEINDLDKMFSLGGELPSTDRLDKDTQPDSQTDKIKLNTIKHLLQKNPNLSKDELEKKTTPDLIKMLRDNLSEMDSQGYKGHRGNEDKGKGPEKVVKPAKAKDVAKDAEKELTKAMDKAHKKGVAEATGDAGFDNMMRRIQAEPKYPDKQMPPTSVPELIQWADQNEKPYHEVFAKWAAQNKFTNVNDALEWFGDNVDPDNNYLKPFKSPAGVTYVIDPQVREKIESKFDTEGEIPLEEAAKYGDKLAQYLMKVYVSYEKIFEDWDDEYRQMNMPDPFNNKSMDEAKILQFPQQSPLDRNVIVQLKSLAKTRLELSWEGPNVPSAWQGQTAKMSKQELARMSQNVDKQLKALGYEWSENEEDFDILYLHSIAREKWYDSGQPMSKYRGLPDLMYNADTNTLTEYDLVGDEDSEYDNPKQFEGMSEDLDANQKRVGQLGPTEKVKNNNIGKLVGASESVEHDPLKDILRLSGK